MWFRRKTLEHDRWDGLNREVMSLTREEKLDEALASAKELLRLSKKQHGKNHANMATALNNLGIIHTLRRELDEAESYLLAALQVSEKVSGKVSNEVAVVNMNLARLYSLKAVVIQEKLGLSGNK